MSPKGNTMFNSDTVAPSLETMLVWWKSSTTLLPLEPGAPFFSGGSGVSQHVWRSWCLQRAPEWNCRITVGPVVPKFLTGLFRSNLWMKILYQNDSTTFKIQCGILYNVEHVKWDALTSYLLRSHLGKIKASYRVDHLENGCYRACQRMGLHRGGSWACEKWTQVVRSPRRTEVVWT